MESINVLPQNAYSRIEKASECFLVAVADRQFVQVPNFVLAREKLFGYKLMELALDAFDHRLGSLVTYSPCLN